MVGISFPLVRTTSSAMAFVNAYVLGHGCINLQIMNYCQKFQKNRVYSVLQAGDTKIVKSCQILKCDHNNLKLFFSGHWYSEFFFKYK